LRAPPLPKPVGTEKRCPINNHLAQLNQQHLGSTLEAGKDTDHGLRAMRLDADLRHWPAEAVGMIFSVYRQAHPMLAAQTYGHQQTNT
jgi:hypothetical protein